MTHIYFVPRVQVLDPRIGAQCWQPKYFTWDTGIGMSCMDYKTWFMVMADTTGPQHATLTANSDCIAAEGLLQKQQLINRGFPIELLAEATTWDEAVAIAKTVIRDNQRVRGH